jgi:hypothetical protein
MLLAPAVEGKDHVRFVGEIVANRLDSHRGETAVDHLVLPDAVDA